MVASPLLNALVGKAGASKPGDWVMKFEPPKPQSHAEMKMLLKALADAGKAAKPKPRSVTHGINKQRSRRPGSKAPR